MISKAKTSHSLESFFRDIFKPDSNVPHRALRWKKYLVVPTIIAFMYLVYAFNQEERILIPSYWVHPKNLAETGKDDRPVVATAACGVQATEEVLLSLRSLILLSHVPFRFVVVADEPTTKLFQQVQRTLPSHVQLEIVGIYKRIPWKYRPWHNAFHEPCHWQRLFLPYILPHDRFVVYVDADVLFFVGVEDVWQAFSRLGPNHLFGFTMEHEENSTSSIYESGFHSGVPYYGKSGLQGGVFSMDLAKLRPMGWEDEVQKILEEHGRLGWMDQDVLNIFGHHHPDTIKVLPCRWNFRQVHCIYEDNRCLPAQEEGIALLHGSGNAFHNWRYPGIRTAADVFREWDFRADPSGLADEMERRIAMLDGNASCDPLRLRFFSKAIRNQMPQAFVASGD
ncbi:unnamed protein product [Darwinula stevensoni]|uniref:UDP-D-xylose:beta-D-glucoside alpha-1,3-D-xylosyltransferase n=1 Tax=Darwinula stevensoni TaxID=69355 RepID=A0A7R8XBU3_9CRUS|nr:unnamed protein product [Darwinula stevensoni]CAG0893166.1 unnamed protein product [Darwinula stevensoni]